MPKICRDWHTRYTADGIALRCGRFETLMPWRLVEKYVAKPPKQKTMAYLADGAEVEMYDNGIRLAAGRYGSRLWMPLPLLRMELREREESAAFVC